MPENITKLKDTILAKCCDQHEVMPKDVCCLKEGVYDYMKELICMHKHAFTKRKRLIRLAEPVRRIERFKPKCACRFGKNIEMVHLEEPMYTRTEQLAYPPLRYNSPIIRNYFLGIIFCFNYSTGKYYFSKKRLSTCFQISA